MLDPKPPLVRLLRLSLQPGFRRRAREEVDLIHPTVNPQPRLSISKEVEGRADLQPGSPSEVWCGPPGPTDLAQLRQVSLHRKSLISYKENTISLYDCICSTVVIGKKYSKFPPPRF